MALTETRVRAIVREELAALLTGALTPTAARAPKAPKASSTAKPNTFAQDVIAGGRKHACAYEAPCEKSFRTAARAGEHWGH